MRAIITSAFAAMILAAPLAEAGQLELRAPAKAGLLNENGIEMVVYYARDDDALEVTAIFPEGSAPDQQARMRVVLMDGDGVSFELPSLPGIKYRFARDGEIVHVKAESKLQLASVTP